MSALTYRSTNALAGDQVEVSAATPLPVTGPASMGGLLLSAETTAKLPSAANTTNKTQVKATAAVLKGIQGGNTTAGWIYLKLYNALAANVTVGTTVPDKTLACPPSAAFAYDFVSGRQFGTALSYALTTLPADNDATAVAAASIVALNIDYL